MSSTESGGRFLCWRAGSMRTARICLACFAVAGLVIAWSAWRDGSTLGALGSLAFAAFLGYALWAGRRTGYVLAPGRLGHRNGMTTRVAWLDLAGVAVMTGQWIRRGPDTNRPTATLWSMRRSLGPVTSLFLRLSATPQVKDLETRVGRLHPFPVHVSYLNESDLDALLAHLRAHRIPVRELGKLWVLGPVANPAGFPTETDG